MNPRSILALAFIGACGALVALALALFVTGCAGALDAAEHGALLACHAVNAVASAQNGVDDAGR